MWPTDRFLVSCSSNNLNELGFAVLSYSSVLFFTKGQDMYVSFFFLFLHHQARLRSILGNKASKVTSSLSEARLDHFTF